MTADARRIIDSLTDPALWRWLQHLPPVSARRILHTAVEEVTALATPPRFMAQRRRRLLDGAALLGLRLEGASAGAFVARADRLQALTQAEELLCLMGDVEAQVRWADACFTVRGLAHAQRVAKAGTGALVVGAHVGPMVYYIPMLVYYLAKGGRLPEILAVMNAPDAARAEAMQAQLARFAPHHSLRFALIAKKPGGDLSLWREIAGALGRGAWVCVQMDVASGGMNMTPIAFAGRRCVFPGIWGAVKLAARTGVPLLPARAWRTRRNGMGLAVLPPVDAAARSPEEAARALAAILEAWVRPDPAQWGQLAALSSCVAGLHDAPDAHARDDLPHEEAPAT